MLLLVVDDDEGFAKDLLVDVGGMMLGRMVGERWSKSTSGVELAPHLAARF